MSFDQLGLAEPILRALAAKNYGEPTPIQAQAIPILLEGGDLLGIAQTGTGKTAAFMLPSIQLLSAREDVRPRPHSCRMLVLAPTRELASQIADSARGYGKFSRLSVATVFGGVSIHRDRQALSRGVDILVATPGRLLDLVDQKLLTLKDIEILVLDEADQMLDLGFIHALRRVHQLVPKDRQSLFFSATMPKAIRELASQFLTDPATVSVTPVSSTAERVDQSVVFVQQLEKQALLTMLIGEMDIDRALVFTRTKHGADRVVKLLAANNVRANAIHGNKSQAQRERALGQFKSGEVRILVATDIAARGIDISGVSHVFNFELPNVPEQYVHRIGRTARAGASGMAVAFCADDERTYLRDIERLTKQKIPVMPLPEGFNARAAELKAARAKVIGHDPAPREDRPRRNGPPRPRATHKPVRTEEAQRHGGRPQGERAQGDGRRPREDDRQRPSRPQGDAPRHGDTHRGEAHRGEGRHQGNAHRPDGKPSGDHRPGRPPHRRGGGGPRRPQAARG